jgi:RNA polymerase sigma-70 factor, ECF subfamily
MEPIRTLRRLGHVIRESTSTEVGVTRLRHDDFAAFYRMHRPEIVRAVTATIGDADLAAEATDEAFARAYAHWRKVSSADNQPGWVYRVALNWSLDQLRRRKRGRLRTAAMAPQATDDPEPMPEVAAALERLSPDHRSVVVLRVWLDWSEAEVAAALGIPKGTVKSRLARALDQMKEVLGDD